MADDTKRNEGGTPQAPEDLSLIDFGVAVLEERRLVARIAFWVVVATILATVLPPRSFSSVGVFVPAGEDALVSRASGLAAQLGVALPSGVGGQTPDFYAELLQSQSVLGAVALDSVTFTKSAWWPWAPDDTISGGVAEILGVDDAALSVRRDKGIMELRDLLEVKVLPYSGTVALKVTTQYAGLSQYIATRLIELVNDYNRTQRQSQARAEREFTEERLRQARTELRIAEDSLRNFLLRNRTYQTSPTLQFEADHLQRELAMRQQALNALNDAFETARIAEVRTTPVISVVQMPIRPGVPDRRYLILKTLVACLVGVGLGGVIVVLQKTLREEQRGLVSGDTRTVRTLWRETAADLKRPWRLLQKQSS